MQQPMDLLHCKLTRFGILALYNSFSVLLHILVFLLGLIVSVPLSLASVQASANWSNHDLKVESGSVVSSIGALTVKAEANGWIFITVPAQGLQLEESPIVTLEFANQISTADLFLIWRTDLVEKGRHKLQLSAINIGTAWVSMENKKGWRGAAEVLGIAIRVHPNQEIAIKSISISSLTILTMAKMLIYEWSSFKPWEQVDINLYTGTRSFDEGTFPVPVFAVSLTIALSIYLAYLLFSRKLHEYNWRIAALLTLACWIGLDLLWQIRLGQQLQDTYATFAKKSTTKKLLASEDRDMVQFISKVREKIVGENTRVFIGSIDDWGGMRGAYYMSPLNTYWHRKGPELPDRRYLRSGDYILLIRPFSLLYDKTFNVIRFSDNDDLPVEPLLLEPMGILLRVI